VKRICEINGIELFCSDVGDHARNVLLVHGQPFNHTMWRPQMEYLRDNYRVLVPDLRGYGKSSLPKIPAKRGFRDLRGGQSCAHGFFGGS
jgi:pimeloyl-ACP methyl ester carboxylesterase